MIMIKTTDKAKKRQTPDDFIAGAAGVNLNKRQKSSVGF